MYFVSAQNNIMLARYCYFLGYVIRPLVVLYSMLCAKGSLASGFEKKQRWREMCFFCNNLMSATTSTLAAAAAAAAFD